MIYSLYIFDRHCTVVYYQDWHRSPLKPARPGSTVLPCVSPAVSPKSSSVRDSGTLNDAARQAAASGRLPFGSRGGIDLGGEDLVSPLPVPQGVAEWKEAQEREARERARKDEERRIGARGLPFDEEAKLVYGVVFSLRNMVKKLAGKDELLHGYSTPTYSMHLLHTPSALTFVLLSSPGTESLRSVLQSIWKGAWLDFVVRNPLVSMDSAVSGRGVDNELFRRAVDTFVRGLQVFS